MQKTYVDIMRELREDNDKTQQELADYLGTSQTMYARYERGANELPIRHLIKLCKFYHVSADYLLSEPPERLGAIFPEMQNLWESISCQKPTI